MDLLSQHEAFLRAIFDAPDDDTPRLVYADFLEEHGRADRADLIRVQCELAANEGGWHHSDRFSTLRDREMELLDRLHPELRYWETHERERVDFRRGFLAEPTAVLCPGELDDVNGFREKVVRTRPHWFGAAGLAVQPGWFLHPEQVDVLFGLAVTGRMTEWDLGGAVDQPDGPPPADLAPHEHAEAYTVPVIRMPGVGALARNPGAGRIATLILTRNNLDHDAARALIRSPHLGNLERLTLRAGNHLDGIWPQLVERFGEDVVG